MPWVHRPVMFGIVLATVLVFTSLALFVFFGTGRSDPTLTSAEVSAASTIPSAEEEPVTTETSGIADEPGTTISPSEQTTTIPPSETTTTTTTEAIILHPWVDRRSVGEPWGHGVTGLLSYRGNPTNTWYGTGPVADAQPQVRRLYPTGDPLCGQSTDFDITSTWCGNGWTGQPVVLEGPDGSVELMVGAYDHQFHFVDGRTGEVTRAPIRTGDLVKGSPSYDPDGFPLVYFGSRDNRLRIAALDRADPEVVWHFETPKPLCTGATASTGCVGRWNDDWDAAPLIHNDYMFEGGENSIFYIWKLNRGYGDDGLVTVDPELVFTMQTWNDEIMSRIETDCHATMAARCVSTSVESSAVMFEGRVYFGTSAGMVFGLDVTNIHDGRVDVVFEYWVGDDVDASIVVDEEGMLYVPVEYKRYNQRGRDLGQLVKLDPYAVDDPYVWGMYSLVDPPAQGGMWSTPVLGDGVVYAVTNKGNLVVVDRETGEELWWQYLAASSWSSPVLVDQTLIVAANDGIVYSFDVSDPRAPHLEWSVEVGGASIEATPAVWQGIIYVFSRDGYLYAIGES